MEKKGREVADSLAVIARAWHAIVTGSVLGSAGMLFGDPYGY